MSDNSQLPEQSPTEAQPPLDVPAGSASAAVRNALAACRAIVFAGKQARRHRGEYSLNDILAAQSLAATALHAAEQEGLQ